MTPEDELLQRDLGQVGLIPELPLILDICRKATGKGFIGRRSGEATSVHKA